jgi:hypothetical protein
MHVVRRISSQVGKNFTVIFFALAILTVATIVLVFVLPINGDDGWIHLNWLEQFSSLFREGKLYPRWMPESFSGYGSAAFYFYPPLPYWIGSIISALIPVASPETLFYTISLLASLLSVVTMQSYLKELGISSDTAIFGSLLYGFSAYRILDIFSRNALSEHFAMIFLPLIFQAIEIAFSTERKKTLRAYILLTAGFCGIILSNIPVAVVAAVTGTIYCLTIVRKKNIKALFPLAAAVIVSLLLSGIYLLPMVLLRSDAHFERLFHLAPGFAAGTSHASFLISIVFLDIRMTTIMSLLSGIGCFILFVRYLKSTTSAADRRLPVTLLWLLAFAIIVQIPYVGYYLHANIFPFSILQFYWRWNIFLTFAVPVSLAIFLPKRKYVLPAMSIISLILVMTTAVIILQFYNSAASGTTYHRDVREYIPHTVTNLSPVADKSDKYGTLRHEWFDTDSSGLIWIHSKDISVKKIDPYDYLIITTLDSPRTVTPRQFYWKYWRMFDEDAGAEISTAPDSAGRVTFNFPAGKHRYSYKLYRSQPEIYGGIVSLAGILAFFLLSLVFRKSQQ